MLEIERILKRINLEEDKEFYPANLQTLQLLIKNYMLSVPYENIDFRFKRGFSANILKIYEKIVTNNRGGICYESNTLFSFLIKTLGFKVQMIFAKVEDLTYIGYDYPHLCLLVTIDEVDYLVDVANGQNIREAMPIEDEFYTSKAESNEYKIRRASNEYVLLVNHKHRSWTPRYHFTKEIKRVADFAYIFEGKDYHTFANKSPLLVTLALENGRVTLLNDMITFKDGDVRRQWNVTDENRNEVLRDYFNISINFSENL